MARYNVLLIDVTEDEFCKRMDGLDKIVKKEMGMVPTMQIEFDGPPEEIYDFLGYTSEEIEAVPYKRISEFLRGRK